MSLTSVVQYESWWSADTHVGQIRILTEHDPNWVLLSIDTVEEFTAVRQILSQPPVKFDSANGSLVTLPRAL